MGRDVVSGSAIHAARLKADNLCFWINVCYRKRHEGRTPPNREIVMSWLEILGFSPDGKCSEGWLSASYEGLSMMRIQFRNGQAVAAENVI